MDIITADFETYYSKEFGFRTHTTEEYVRDPQFEVIGVSVKVNDGQTVWFTGTHEETQEFLSQYSWESSALLAQNTMFDGAILSWLFGIVPKVYLDTMSMAKALHGTNASASLKALAERYGIGIKGTEVVDAMGLRRKDFTPRQLAAYGQYCINDTELTYKLFELMGPKFPKSELKLIDITLRMFTTPRLEVDVPLLQGHLKRIKADKQALLDSVGLDKKQLMSNPKFAEELEALGVVPPRKLSPTTGKETFAFAKTDPQFQALQEHDDVRVQTLVAARLGNKSTQEETRTERFIGMGLRGKFPVPLNYYGAHCLLPDAEILTFDGWERLDTWKGGHIMQWDKHTRLLEFLPATPNVFDVDEELIRYESRYHNATYTKGHTIPCISSRGRLSERKAGEAAGVRYQLPISGGTSGGKDYPEIEIRLSVMAQADGSVRGGREGKAVVFGFRKARKIERCRDLLDRAGVPFSEFVEKDGVTTRIRVGAKHVHELTKFLYGKSKDFTSSLLNASYQNKLAFIDELRYWDGAQEPNKKSISYCTTNKSNAEFVQTMAHLCGYAAYVGTRKRSNPNWSISYRVHIRKNTDTRAMPKQVGVVSYRGKVYCPTTEKGFFLFRQNGSICITGNTGRWSGKDSVNLQNLPSRGPNAKVLKRALCAPEGYLVVESDSSQIEARVLAWLAEQEDLVRGFAEKRDVYKYMASDIYNKSVEDIDKGERFIGKSSILGCVAEGTPVLSERGWIPIEEVTSEDKLWDGEDWVCHQGLVWKGYKETLSVYGSWLTPDHKILCGTKWVESGSAVQSESILYQALVRGAENLPSQAMLWAREAGLKLSSSSAVVDFQNTLSITTILKRLNPLDVTSALRNLATVLGKHIGNMRTSFLTTVNALGYSTGYHQPSLDATTQETISMGIMAVGGLQYTKSGETTGENSSLTSSRAKGGITQTLRWIGRIITEGMNRVTYGLFLGPRTSGTSAASAPCKRRLRTYDVAYVGPNSRFTIWSNAGPLIVHNCGYQMGALRFKDQLATFGIQLDLSECRRIIGIYRSKNYKIKALWDDCQTAIECMYRGTEFVFGRNNLLRVDPKQKAIVLPNGLCIYYPELTKRKTEKGYEYVYKNRNGVKKLYGGALTENICQALARLIIGDQMTLIHKKYFVALTVHDSVAAIVPEHKAVEGQAYVEQCMRTVPAWGEGLPLDCESGTAKNYGDCDGA